MKNNRKEIVPTEKVTNFGTPRPDGRSLTLNQNDTARIKLIQRDLKKNEIGETIAPLLDGFSSGEYKEAMGKKK